MLLSKIKISRPFILWKTYAAWIFFCFFILYLTNAIASLNLITEYHFFFLDVLFTYGLLIFYGFLETAVLAALLVLVEISLERAFKRRFELMFRATLIALLVATWAILLQIVFTYVL